MRHKCYQHKTDAEETQRLGHRKVRFVLLQVSECGVLSEIFCSPHKLCNCVDIAFHHQSPGWNRALADNFPLSKNRDETRIEVRIFIVVRELSGCHRFA